MTATGRFLQDWTEKSPPSPSACFIQHIAACAFSTRPRTLSTNLTSPSSRGPYLAYRVGRLALCAWALVGGLALASAGASAGAADRYWNEPLAAASRCEAALNDSGSAALRCLLGSGLDLVSNEGLRFANEAGKDAFGEHFQMVGNLTWSPTSASGGFEGNLDTVIPLSSVQTPHDARPSLFFQQGVTRWWDGFGTIRNDLRHGMAHRFRLSDSPDADVLGVSAFHLLSAEYGHQVVVSGVDYAGNWGTGSLRYFLPTTDWRPVSSGYEERALEGVEFGMRLDLTATLGVDTTGYRWRAEDGSRRWTEGVRLGIDWRPHPWLNLHAGYNGVGAADEAASFRIGVAIPLGSADGLPRWEGLGVAAGGTPPDASDLWRPVEDVGRIRVATRTSVSRLIDNAEIRFLQDTDELPPAFLRRERFHFPLSVLTVLLGSYDIIPPSQSAGCDGASTRVPSPSKSLS